MNALEELEIYNAYNNDSSREFVLNEQLNFESNRLYDTALRPVSYTHLDVYKRQVWYRLETAQQYPISSRQYLNGCAPVSYTHLVGHIRRLRFSEVIL